MILETGIIPIEFLMDNAIDGIILFDLKSYNILFVNNTFCNILKVDKSKLEGISFLELVPDSEKKRFFNYITKLNKLYVREKNFTLKLLKYFKEPIEVELIGTFSKYDRHHSIFLGIVRDLSRTAKLENVFTAPTINFKEISESINDAICIIRINGRFIYASPRLPAILGNMEITSDFYDLIHPEDLGYIKDYLTKAAKDKKVVYLDPIEFRIIHKFSEYIWVEASIRKYLDKSNRLLGFIIVLREINERKKLEQELKNYHSELEKKNKELMELDEIKSEFLSNASHELRTPLVSIKGFTELLLNGSSGKLTKQQIEDLSIILRNTERIINLVDDLLDVSKLESGMFIINKKDFDIVELVYECVHELHHQIEAREHNIELHLPDHEIIVHADRNRIHQLITNLLDNAIKYTPKKGVIEIYLRKDDEKIHFFIKDNGIGLKQDEIKKIFKRFGKIYMPDEVDFVDARGTGLGLVICKGIVEKHNGKIWATSEGRNKGSEFHFIIPIK
ncbi:MAG: PAS domain-containing sensor histidine kinase [Candidatus Helarchaeota archaeon]